MHRLLAIILLSLLCACTYNIPRDYLPRPLSNGNFADPTKTVAIPLPVIASSPNEGITYGGLVAFLLHNAKDEVSTLIVPQENYNQYFGVTSTLYGAFYLTPDESLRINLSKATNINEEFRLRYENQKFRSDRYNLYINAFDFADGSTRFFGFQSHSAKEDETNYTDHEAGFTLAGGWHFADDLQLVLGERYKKVFIGRGAVKSLPFITERFPKESIPGVDGYSVHAQRVALVHSTLDSLNMPTNGLFVSASLENSAKILGSSASYQVWDFEAKRYYSMHGGRYISVIRFVCNQTEGVKVPFLEQSILGGENTLRGYGQNRFIDKSYLLLNLEERIRLFRWEIFNVMADWEAAPFVDLGAVMRSVVEAKASSFEFNPGIGLRTVVRPNIVGRIDVGIGKEGPSVFVGLGYPF